MHALGERFGEAVAQRGEEDRVVVVVVALEALGALVFAVAGRHGERADVVRDAGFERRDEVGEREIRVARVARELLAQRVQRRERTLPPLVRVEDDVVDHAVGRPDAQRPHWQ